MDFLTETQKTVLDLLANALFKSGRNIDYDNINWQSVRREAYMQTVPLIAFSGTVPCVQDDVLRPIRKNLNEALTSSLAVNKAHIKLHKIMTEVNIPYVILKGYAAAAYYPDPLLRSMGDVDFLVSQDDFKKADEILCNAGFVKSKSDHFCHTVYTDGSCRFEMHSEPAGIPDGTSGERIREYLSNVIECKKVIDTPFGEMCVPSDFHHGLIILLHTAHHLTGEGVGLRHLCDWAAFVARYTYNEFCNAFEDKLKRVGLWEFAQLLTKLSVDYLGCPVEGWRDRVDPSLADEIMKDIFKSGNLGQKSPDRSHESLLIAGNGQYKTEDVSLIRQLFISANNIVYNNWKITRKLKILLPLGWAFFGGRYIIRSFLGKRPQIRPKNIATEAVARKELYKKLKLFIYE